MSARRPLVFQGPHRSALSSFFFLELVCLGGFFAALAEGKASVAAAFLAGPLQLLAWTVMMDDDISILLYFAFLFPLAPLAFVPHAFGRYVLYPGTILLLLLPRLVWPGKAGREVGPRMSGRDWAPGQAYMTCLVVSFVFALVRGLGSRHLAIQNLLMLEIAVLTYFYATTPNSEREVLRLLLASGVAVVLVSLAVPLLGASAGADVFTGGKVRTGPFGVFDLNTLGGIVAILMSVMLCLTIDARRPRARAVLVLALLTLLAALIATRSRGAWLGLGAGLVYIVARKRSLATILTLAGAATLLLVSDVLRHTVLVRLGQTSIEDASLAGRASLWHFALDMFRDNWLTGVGWENFRVLKVHYGFPLFLFGWTRTMCYNTHSIYIETLTGLGVVGLAAFLWFLATVFLRTDRIARSRHKRSAGLAAALNAGLIVFAVHGLWDCLTAMFMVPAALIGLAMCLWRLEHGRALVPAGAPRV